MGDPAAPEETAVISPLAARRRGPGARSPATVLTALTLAAAVATAGYVATVRGAVIPYLESEKREGRVRNVYALYETLAAEGGARTALVLGSSQVLEGVDGGVVEAQLRERGLLEWRVLNIGKVGDSPMYRLPELEPLARCRAGFVIYATSAFAVSKHRPVYEDHMAVEADLIAAPAGAPWRAAMHPALLRVLDRPLLGKYLALRRHALNALRWALLPTGKREERRPPFNTNWRDPWQNESEPDPSAVRRALQARAVHWAPYYGPDLLGDPPDGPNFERRALGFVLDELARWRDAFGTRVLVVDMPLNPLLLDFIDPANLEPWRAFLQKECSARALELLPWDQTLPPEAFADVVHLARPGRERLSRMLADEVARRLGA